MSKRAKKALSFALSVILLLGILPLNLILTNTESEFLENLGGFLNKALSGINASAFSFGGSTTIVPTVVYDEETATLTISGAGNLYDYTPVNRPWAKYAETCENLIVESAITSIGSKSFFNFTKLKSVTIKANITSISRNMFEGCTSLESIVIPNTVTRISQDAFLNCISLKNVTLPKNLEYLSGFRGCTSLESINIPYKVICINNGCFDGCTSLKEVNIPYGVMSISEYAFRNCTELNSISLPETLEEIGMYAFQNTTALGKNLVIPDSVKRIGIGAFSGNCFESIKTPFVGSDATNNEQDADIYFLGYWFGSYEYENSYECSYSKKTYYLPLTLKSVTLTKYLYEDNFKNVKTLEEIIIQDTVKATSYPDSFAFGCTALKSVINNSRTITSFDANSFRGCSELENIQIPQKLEVIGSMAFAYCKKLSDITFPFKDFVIKQEAFLDTAFLNEYDGDFVVVGDGVLLKYIGEATNVVIPSTVKRISTSFYNCKHITDVTIPDSVLYINQYSFYDCKELKNLYIPDSVIEISQNAFYYMSDKLNLSVPFIGKNRSVVSGKADAKIIYWFGNNSNSISSLTLRNGVAFSECGKGMRIRTLNIEANVEKLMKSCFRGSGIYYLNISPDVKFTEIPDKAFSENYIKTLVIPGVIKVIGTAFIDNAITELTLSEGIEEINSSFRGARFTSVFLPESLISIKGTAFENSNSLKDVSIGKNVSFISETAFRGSSVENFSISSENPYFFSEGPAIYNSDGELYYYNRPNSAKVLYIGERVTSISDEQLKDFSSLTEYQVDENNKIYSSRDGLLYKNSGKLLFSVPQKYNNDLCVTSDTEAVGDFAFYKVNLPTLKFLGDTRLQAGILQNAKIENLYFYNVNISLEDLFYGYPELKSVTITNQTDDIPERFAFQCKIENITINGSSKKLGASAFSLGEFKNITLPDSLELIGDNAFNNTKLESVYLGKALEDIGYAAFYFCNVPEIELPETVLTIGDSAFFGTKFTEIKLGEKIKTVGEYAFSGSSLKKAVINEKIVDMSDMIFQNCKDLEIVVVGSHVTRIGDLAFQNCNALNTVVIPDSVTEISEDAFSGANEDVIIYCNKNSYAQSYAEKYNIKYTTLVLDSIPNQTYTSKPIEPEVNAKANNKNLTLNKEYTLDFSDNVNVGRAKVVAKGLGDFRHLVATAHFEILSKPVSDVVVTSYDTYYHPKGSEPKLSLYIGENKLVQGVDYEILDNGNSMKNVGTYNVTVKGIGNLTGTYNTTYKILQRSITVTTIKSGDELVVTDSGCTLVEGTDYIVENRVDENGNEKIVVVGIGNYTDEKIYEEKGDLFPDIFTNVITLLLELLKKLFSIF
ncbi:MAG: hypothetical protein E7522_02910 [Ruminococcaceae bacterium]|nr:hypothetical protein [Oscillospiraceae bacterium]